MKHLHSMKPSRCAPAARQVQTGSTLIEVLVAALILSIGIMALVGVQGTSAQMSKMSQQRGEASRLAQNFADRVRANVDTLNPIGSVQAYTINAAYNGNVAAQNIPATCKGNVTCTPAALAQLDLAELREQARLLLPNGAFYIVPTSVGAAPNTAYSLDIWVIWQTASTKSDDTGTLTGLACPAGAVTAGTKNVQCLLTRVML